MASLTQHDDAPDSRWMAPRVDSLPSALKLAEHLAITEANGQLHVRGNWSLGQTCAHLAWWADEAFEPHPFPLYLRVFFKIAGPMSKRRALTGRVPPGLRLPGVRGGTFGAEPCRTDEGLKRLRSAFNRLERECPTRPDVGFGRLTHDEWKRLHANHARHHLAFFAASDPNSSPDAGAGTP